MDIDTGIFAVFDNDENRWLWITETTEEKARAKYVVFLRKTAPNRRARFSLYQKLSGARPPV